MNPIETVASIIQRLPSEARWLYAQPEVIRAIAQGAAPMRGRWGARADRIVAWTARLGVARVAVMFATLWLLLLAFIRQYGVRTATDAHGAAFIGLAAMRDPALITLFAARVRCRPLVLDERDIASFRRCRRVGLRRLLSEWRGVWKEIWPHLSQSEVVGFDLRYCLSGALKRLDRVVYLRAWLRDYCRASGTRMVGVSAASYVSFAAVASGARVIYLPHGFQRRSLALPDFAEIISFNSFEADHFRARLPAASVTMLPPSREGIETERVAAIAGDYWEGQNFDLCRSFIEWAQQHWLPVVVRPHPQDRTGYWQQWRGAPGIRFDDAHCDFDTFLQRIRPRLLVTWTSTTIFDALVRGVVPVTLVDERFDKADFVFPFGQIALQWPAATEQIAGLVDQPEACRRLVREKTSQVTGSQPPAKPAPACRAMTAPPAEREFTAPSAASVMPRPRRIFIPRPADASNVNAQAKNAQYILRHWQSRAWRPAIAAFTAPDEMVSTNRNVDIIKFKPDHLWRVMIYLAYFRRFDAIFYPGVHHLADWLALRTRAFLGWRLPLIGTFEGLAGSLEDDSWEREYSAAAGHRVYCQKIPEAHLRRLDDIQRMAGHIIAISPFLGRMARSRYGDKVSVLSLGVHTDLFGRPSFSRRARLRVIGAGRVARHKRPELFVTLAAKFPRADFVWFGDGDLRCGLVSEIAERGLPNLAFPGALPPQLLAQEFAASDVFILPSLSEGVPKVTQEAAAAGLAQIIFGFYEAPTVIDGVNGFVVWSDEEMCDRLAQLVGDPDTVESMGRAGVRMAQDWSWETVAPQWEQKIIAILGKGAAVVKNNRREYGVE